MGINGRPYGHINVDPVTAKLLYILLVLCFLHHERHHHYCWCNILFWSLDSGLYLIKSKIYDSVQSATSTSPSAHIVVAPIKPHKCTVSSRHYASNPRSRSHGTFINLLVKPHMNILCRVDSVWSNSKLPRKSWDLQQELWLVVVILTKTEVLSRFNNLMWGPRVTNNILTSHESRTHTSAKSQ